MIRTYSELIQIDSFIDRFNYLKLNGRIGQETFGFDRYLNQVFYNSDEWRKSRRFVIMRDSGCDLGILDREIFGKIIIHHMNPITENEIINRSSKIFDPEFLISTSVDTHNGIHFGSESYLSNEVVVERFSNDTSPWLYEGE